LRSRRAGIALAVLGGALVAFSLPPWGWWPLAFVGIAVFEVALGTTPTRRRRFALGFSFAGTWLLIGMCWMWFLSAPGYIAATVVYAGYHGVAALLAPGGRWRVLGRPAAHTLAEALRFSFPFGGVPLASLAISQAAGPLLPVVRVGGALLLTWVVFQIGFGLGAVARRDAVMPAVAGALAALLLLPLAWLAPSGTNPGSALRVTVVQGGGPQGTHAVEAGDSAEVFARHLAATEQIPAGSTDLVVWPENVIDVPEFIGSAQLGEVADQAARIGAPFAVGVTEDAGPHHFLNAEMIVAPDGTVVSRYDKVRRVPFGEYMPLRGLLHALGAPTDLVPRDAVAGHGPAVLTLPSGLKLAVVISWEVFFGGRANEGVEHGGTVILNPTNGSSYTWTVLQSQQLASSRLRAMEQGRWVVQAAPTGFSAFVSPAGDVHQRTAISEQAVISRTITTHTGRTWYSRLGNLPIILFVVVANVVAIAGKKRPWRSSPTPP
jgi:apolipoprotein N-acyltransferase